MRVGPGSLLVLCALLPSGSFAKALSVDWTAPRSGKIGAEAAESDGYFRSVDLPGLSREDPLKAAAVLAAAACLERAKFEAESGDPKMLEWLVRELAARIALLRDGVAPAGNDGRFDLLNLTAGFDSQVRVDYFHGHEEAVVTLYEGPVPLICARISCSPAREEAEEAFRKTADPVIASLDRELNGRKVVVSERSFSGAYISDYDGDAHYIYVDRDGKRGYIVGLDRRPAEKAAALVVTPGCSEAAARKAGRFAKGKPRKRPGRARRYVIAGPLDGKEWKRHAQEALVAVDETSAPTFAALVGGRLVRISSGSDAAAGRMFDLVEARRGFAAEDAAFIRNAVFKTLRESPEGDPPPEGAGLHVGEVHAHTFYSDGRVSPEGLTLQAIASFQDFLVISDHNSIDGALSGASALKRHGFEYAVIVGEEVTTVDNHFNAYPLRSFISPDLRPREIAEAAHSQGAVAQWNHPGWPETDWAGRQYPKLLAGTGLDAWEHVHWKLPEWKRSGTAPLTVGSTDTHSGLFAHGERTAVFSRDSGGAGLAAAIRARWAAAVSWRAAGLFLGDDAPASRAAAALRSGDGVRRRKLAHLGAIMRRADLAGLLRDSAPHSETILEIDPVRRLAAGRRVRLRATVANLWYDHDVRAVVSVVPGESLWEGAAAEATVRPGGRAKLILKPRVGARVFPLPSVVLRLYRDGELIATRHGEVVVGKGVRLKRRLLDDFEDGNRTNMSAAAGLADSPGTWDAVADEFGVTKLSRFEFPELAGGRPGARRACRVSGRLGVSRDPEWVWAMLQTFVAGSYKPVDLSSSRGLAFRARSGKATTVRVVASGWVKGKRTSGTGRDHGVEITLGEEWKEYVLTWDRFRQPGYACPGEMCLGPLTVDRVESIGWVIRGEGKEFDVWLDDVALLYE